MAEHRAQRNPPDNPLRSPFQLTRMGENVDIREQPTRPLAIAAKKSLQPEYAAMPVQTKYKIQTYKFEDSHRHIPNSNNIGRGKRYEMDIPKNYRESIPSGSFMNLHMGNPFPKPTAPPTPEPPSVPEFYWKAGDRRIDQLPKREVNRISEKRLDMHKMQYYEDRQRMKSGGAGTFNQKERLQNVAKHVLGDRSFLRSTNKHYIEDNSNSPGTTFKDLYGMGSHKVHSKSMVYTSNKHIPALTQQPNIPIPVNLLYYNNM